MVLSGEEVVLRAWGSDWIEPLCAELESMSDRMEDGRIGLHHSQLSLIL